MPVSWWQKSCVGMISRRRWSIEQRFRLLINPIHIEKCISTYIILVIYAALWGLMFSKRLVSFERAPGSDLYELGLLYVLVFLFPLSASNRDSHAVVLTLHKKAVSSGVWLELNVGIGYRHCLPQHSKYQAQPTDWHSNVHCLRNKVAFILRCLNVCIGFLSRQVKVYDKCRVTVLQCYKKRVGGGNGRLKGPLARHSSCSGPGGGGLGGVRRVGLCFLGKEHTSYCVL